MYVAGKQLEYYSKVNLSDSVRELSKQTALLTIQNYVSELKNSTNQDSIKPIELKLEKLLANSNSSKDDICYLITETDRHIRENLAIPPTMIVHGLLKELSKMNLVHVDLVKRHSHTLGETGDKINDLYSYLLTSFTQFTLAEEPMTVVNLKLIDKLTFAMAKALSPVKEKAFSDVQAMRASGGSPLHSQQEKLSDNELTQESKIKSTFQY